MISKEKWLQTRSRALELYQAANIVLTSEEINQLEIADFGLGRLEEIELEINTYVNTERVCAKKLPCSHGKFALNICIPAWDFNSERKKLFAAVGVKSGYTSPVKQPNPSLVDCQKVESNTLLLGIKSSFTQGNNTLSIPRLCIGSRQDLKVPSFRNSLPTVRMNMIFLQTLPSNEPQKSAKNNTGWRFVPEA